MHTEGFSFVDVHIERTLIPIIFTFVAFHGHSMQCLTLKVPNSLYLKPLKRFHCQTGSQTVSTQLQFTKSILWFKFLLLKWTYQKHLKSNTILCFRKHAKWYWMVTDNEHNNGLAKCKVFLMNYSFQKEPFQRKL